MTQGARDSEGTGLPERAVGPAGHHDPADEARVPAQGRGQERTWPGGAAPRHRSDAPTPPVAHVGHSGAERTRGEHVHGEDGPGEHARGASGGGAFGDGPARAVVRRSSVRGQVLEALRAALTAGELVPGEVYSGPALGERFGVSATPVREAMQQLALEGAVEVVPNRGFRVTVRGPRELAELAEVRALLEVPVVLRLARTVPSGDWAVLRPLAEATVRAASTGCRATYAESDRAFHRGVLALAGNEQLVRVVEDLHRRAQWPPAGEAAGGARNDLVADAAEHTAMLDALVAHDLETVRSLVREHYTVTR